MMYIQTINEDAYNGPTGSNISTVLYKHGGVYDAIAKETNPLRAHHRTHTTQKPSKHNKQMRKSREKMFETIKY